MRFLSRRHRRVLDTVATITMIVAASALLWRTLRVPTGRVVASVRRGVEPVGPILPEVPLEIDAAATFGSPSSQVILVQFMDYQCPFCLRFAELTYPELERRYIDTGLVQFAVKHLPLDVLHPAARAAAIATSCAAKHGQFWPFHRAMASAGRVDLETVRMAIGKLPGNRESVLGCADAGETAAEVAADVEYAASLGITGTPTFLLGPRLDASTLRVDRILVGAQPLEVFEQAIARLLPAMPDPDGTP